MERRSQCQLQLWITLQRLVASSPLAVTGSENRQSFSVPKPRRRPGERSNPNLNLEVSPIRLHAAFLLFCSNCAQSRPTDMPTRLPVSGGRRRRQINGVEYVELRSFCILITPSASGVEQLVIYSPINAAVLLVALK